MAPRCRVCAQEMTNVEAFARRQPGMGHIPDAGRTATVSAHLRCPTTGCAGAAMTPEHSGAQAALQRFRGDVTVKCRDLRCVGARYTVQRTSIEETVELAEGGSTVQYRVDNVMRLSPKLQPSQTVTVAVEVLATHTDADKLKRLSDHFGADNVCEVPVRRVDIMGGDNAELLQRLKRGLRNETMRGPPSDFSMQPYRCGVNRSSDIDLGDPDETKHDDLMVASFRKGHCDPASMGAAMVEAHAVGGQVMARQEHPGPRPAPADFFGSPATIPPSRACFRVVRRTEP